MSTISFADAINAGYDRMLSRKKTIQRTLDLINDNFEGGEISTSCSDDKFTYRWGMEKHAGDALFQLSMTSTDSDQTNDETVVWQGSSEDFMGVYDPVTIKSLHAVIGWLFNRCVESDHNFAQVMHFLKTDEILVD